MAVIVPTKFAGELVEVNVSVNGVVVGVLRFHWAVSSIVPASVETVEIWDQLTLVPGVNGPAVTLVPLASHPTSVWSVRV